MSMYEDIIYGEDGDSKLRTIVTRVLVEAKEEKARLRIEMRSHTRGSPSSIQEGVFVVNPEDTSADVILTKIVERLESSPGEGFSGQLRINFTRAEQTADRYASYTHTFTPYHRRPAEIPDAPTEDGGDEDAIPNDSTSLRRYPPPDDFMGGSSDAVIDLETFRAYLDTTMGFTFRAFAQNAVLTERVIRMLEAYSLRFGVQPPEAPGIEVVQGSSAPAAGGDNALLGILKMALRLANADSPGQAAGDTARAIGGQLPSDAQTRSDAARTGGRALAALRNRPQRAMPVRPAAGEVFTDDEDDEGDEVDDSGLDESMAGDVDLHPEESDDEYEEEETHLARRPSSGPPDLTDLPPDQMKAAVLAWIKKDPSRKGEVLKMLPELSTAIDDDD
jgi:hypothetical protein